MSSVSKHLWRPLVSTLVLNATSLECVERVQIFVELARGCCLHAFLPELGLLGVAQELPGMQSACTIKSLRE